MTEQLWRVGCGFDLSGWYGADEKSNPGRAARTDNYFAKLSKNLAERV